MGWLGLDDTDSLGGGCTTHLFDALLSELPENVVCGEPRLVRLWPFAQRRTRGNAALAVELSTVDVEGLLGHLDAFWNERILPLKGKRSPGSRSPREQVESSPGMVWFEKQPNPAFYWEAVRRHVEHHEVPQPSRSWGEHGVVGAAAAVSWPAETVTWEAIAWREANATGDRSIDEDILEEVDGWQDIVFSRDPRRGTGLIAPRGASPVLFGVRSLTQKAATAACKAILDAPGTEPCASWRVFCTNQASGDHLAETYRGQVRSTSLHAERKHVQVSTTTFEMVSFAEGGPVNSLARWLKEGDEIEAKGLVHPNGTLHVEQLLLVRAVARRKHRPLCQKCNVRTKSMGSNQGVRCPLCKARFADTWDEVEPEPPYIGWTEPPVDARRHLARPLAWGRKDTDDPTP